MRRKSGSNGTVMVLRSNVPFKGTRCRTAVSCDCCARGMPFCCCGWTAPFCCEGTIGAGACSALIADAADELGPADAMGCGRAVVIPETGSVLVAGHSPLGALVLRAAHAASLPFGGATPFGWGGGAEAVEPVEACDESDVEEFVRWALRGTKMAPPLGAPSALHGCRLML